MMTLVGLHELHRSCFPQQVFGRQLPPRAGYKFRDRAVCLRHGRDQVQVSGFVVAEIRTSSAASFLLSSGSLASPSPFMFRLPVSSRLSLVSGVDGAGAWHPLAPSWVPRPVFFLRVASRFCQCCWVLLFVVASGCSHALWVRGALRSHPSIDLQLPRCLLPRLLNQCRLVFVLLGFGFLGVSCPRSCLTLFSVLRFLVSFHLCGLPCLVHVSISPRH